MVVVVLVEAVVVPFVRVFFRYDLLFLLLVPPRISRLMVEEVGVKLFAAWKIHNALTVMMSRKDELNVIISYKRKSKDGD